MSGSPTDAASAEKPRTPGGRLPQTGSGGTVASVANTQAVLESALAEVEEALLAECGRGGRRRNGSARRFSAEASEVRAHLQRPELRCPIVGITKAGKSAFINALLGAELLPSTNVPSTSFCIRIRHTTARAPLLTAGGELLAEGAVDVLAELRKLADTERERRTGAAQDLALDVSFPFLADRARQQPLQFTLVDTPGVTEADGGRLTRETLAALRDSDAAILALNYAELRTTAEEAFLARCARTRPDLFLRPGRSFFCMVTKIDLRNRNGIGMRAVERHVHEQLALALRERIPTLKQSVWPIRGELAFLARLNASGLADDGQRHDYLKLLFGSQGARRNLTREHLASLTASSVEISRVPEVEAALKDRVVASSTSVRHAAVRGRLINLLHRAGGWARGTRRWQLNKKLLPILDTVKAARPSQVKRGR